MLSIALPRFVCASHCSPSHHATNTTEHASAQGLEVPRQPLGVVPQGSKGSAEEGSTIIRSGEPKVEGPSYQVLHGAGRSTCQFGRPIQCHYH